MKHAACSEDELIRSPVIPVNVDGRDVAVCRLPTGEIRAIRDVCPHRQAKLSRGKLLQALGAADVGLYAMTDTYVLRCPYHGYEFDLATGRCLGDPEKVRVKTYHATVVDGTVFIES